MHILLLFLTIFIISFISADQRSFYIGPNFLLSPCSHPTNKLCMEVRITKPSNWTTGESEGVIYEGDTVEVTCYPSSTKFSPTLLHGFLQDSSVTTDIINDTNIEIDGITVARYTFFANSSDVKNYTCWDGDNSSDESNITNIPFVVKKVQKPVLKNGYHKNQTLENGKAGKLECEIDGYPTPTYKWFKNGTEITIGNSTSSRILTIENVNWNDGGIYNCTAINRAGFASQSIRVEIVKSRRSIEIVKDNNHNNSGLTVGMIMFIICLKISSFYWCYRIYKSKSTRNLRKDLC